RIGADESACADLGPVLAETIVVTCDGAGADIGVGADMGVADIAQMVDLDAGIECCSLGLDEVADFGALAERGPWTQPCIRADRSLLSDRGLDDVAKGMDDRAVADRNAG